jgi:two-component system cell cycle response regulator CtrA
MNFQRQSNEETLLDKIRSLQERIVVIEEENDLLREELITIKGIHRTDIRGKVVYNLTMSEAKILNAFMGRREVTKHQLMAAIYSNDDPPQPKIVDVFVCKLRKKLARRGIVIHTIWGSGYMIDATNKVKIQKDLQEFEMGDIAP